MIKSTLVYFRKYVTNILLTHRLCQLFSNMITRSQISYLFSDLISNKYVPQWKGIVLCTKNYSPHCIYVGVWGIMHSVGSLTLAKCAAKVLLFILLLKLNSWACCTVYLNKQYSYLEINYISTQKWEGLGENVCGRAQEGLCTPLVLRPGWWCKPHALVVSNASVKQKRS